VNVYVVIPTYNEAENLELLVNQVLALQPTFNIIVVDDNSPDGTGRIAETISCNDPRVSVIHRPQKAGLGTAYVDGFKQALANNADLIFEMDADLSHDPVYLQDFLEASKTADVVIGSRYVNGGGSVGWPFRRVLLSKLANIYVSYIMVKPVWDFTAGFRCYRRAVIERIDLNSIRSDGYAFQIEMTYLTFKYGFKVCEIPILFNERQNGYSKISRKVVWEALWLTLKCHAPTWEITKHLSFLFRDYSKFVEKHPQYFDK